jgi:hypothetical protein
MPHGVPMSWMAGLYNHAALFVDRGEALLLGRRQQQVHGRQYR